MPPTSQISWWSFRMGHGRVSVGISVHVLVSLSFPFPLPLPLSLSLSSSLSLSLKVSPTSPSLLEISIFQMFNRFVKIIPPRGIHPIGVGGGQYTSREQQHPELSLASPGRAQCRHFLFGPSPTASALAPAQCHSISRKAPLTRGSFSHNRGGAGWNPGVKLWKNGAVAASSCALASDVKLPFFPPCLHRPVACGAEKIVFITCQDLPELSYVRQDSIKLSYTSMKLQNRLELNNKIISFRREAIPFFSSDTLTAKLWIEIECEGHGIETAITRSSM